MINLGKIQLVLDECEMMDEERAERETYTQRKNKCLLDTQMMALCLDLLGNYHQW